MFLHLEPAVVITVFIWFVLTREEYNKEDKTCLFDVPGYGKTNCTCYNSSTANVSYDCSRKGLRAFPVFPLHSYVEEIRLVKNELNQFDDYTRFPISVRILDLSVNQLESFTETAFRGLKHLQTLNLSNNLLLTKRSAQPLWMFKDLISLKVLDMQHNTIINDEVRHSNAFSTLMNLTDLITDALHFPMFDSGMRNLVKLETLRLSGKTGICFLYHLNDSAFSNLPFLKTISITYCGLQEIHIGTFSGHLNLNELDISYNQELTFNVLPNVTYDLQSLNTSVLKINKIHCTFGRGTVVMIKHIKNMKQTRLTELHIDNNRLNLIEYGVASYMPDTLKFIYARLNSFVFGAYMFEIYKIKNIQRIGISWGDFKVNSMDALSLFVCNDTKSMYCSLGERTIQNTSIIMPPPLSLCYLPKSLTVMNASKSHFLSRSNPFQEIENFGFGNNSLETLDLSHNVLRKWEGLFYGLDRLKNLNLSNNGCENVSLSFFHRMSALETLRLDSNYLSYSFRNDKKGELFSNLQALKELDLSNNQISSLPMEFLKGLTSLLRLYLHTNMMNKWETRIGHMKNLQYLDLSNNSLTFLDDVLTNDLEEIVNTYSKTSQQLQVRIDGNVFECTCGSLHKLRWISKYRKHIDKFENNHCLIANGTVYYFSRLDDIILNLEKECKSYIGMIIGLTALLLCFCCLLISTLIYRYRWRLRYLYYMTRNTLKGYQLHPSQEQMSYLYDAFVSYADEDKDFVHGEMLEELETVSGFKLCLSSRDFRPGVPIAANITNAINQSRRTIAVISTNYLRSEWCKYELNMARMESLYTRAGDDVLFLILYHDIPVHHLPRCVLEVAQGESFIEFPRCESGRVVFWGKIRETLSS